MLRRMMQSQNSRSGVYSNTPIGDLHRTMDWLERDLFFEFATEHAHTQRYNCIKRSTESTPAHHQQNEGMQKAHDSWNTKTARKSIIIQSILCRPQIIQQ